jgi:hypothetical protein
VPTHTASIVVLTNRDERVWKEGPAPAAFSAR